MVNIRAKLIVIFTTLHQSLVELPYYIVSRFIVANADGLNKSFRTGLLQALRSCGKLAIQTDFYVYAQVFIEVHKQILSGSSLSLDLAGRILH